MTYLHRLMLSRSGNFGIVFAILLPFIFGTIGLSIDYVMLSNRRQLLQGALDAAALSSASALAAKSKTTGTIDAYALSFVTAELSGQISAADLQVIRQNAVVTATKVTSGTKKTYTVKITGAITAALTPFSKFLGRTSAMVRASSITSSTVQSTAISLYLVVDRSGSMSFQTDTVLASPSSCQNYTASNWKYYPNLGKTSPCHLNKIAALKQAASDLFDELDQIEAVDSTDKVVRTGAVSFTDSQQTASDIGWGTTSDSTYITALPDYPTGGTDMTDAMDTAYKALIASKENAAQTAQNNTNVQKFIVLMTDGENTGASNVWNPTLDAETLKTCKLARDAGITIYTVAFMAPDNGKTLLQDCSGNLSNYFAADDADALVAAFQAIGNKISNRATLITN